ncbi:hypothetical protein HanRHA438_Chr02g0091741 [Helianthus annuus]|nr:hypothetical protein HanRHA438_Chr02g0091741 [Helianthus annuus]
MTLYTVDRFGNMLTVYKYNSFLKITRFYQLHFLKRCPDSLTCYVLKYVILIIIIIIHITLF